MALLLLLAVAGILASCLALYAEPLFIAHRIEESPEAVPHNEITSLIPLLGGFHLLHANRAHPGGFGKADSNYGIQSLAAQVVMGVIFVGFGLHFHEDVRTILACLYTMILFEIALIDFHFRLVLNVLSYPSAVLAAVGSVFWNGIGLKNSLIGGAVAIACFFVVEVVGRGAMGRGDTKLAGLIGLMRGFPAALTAIVAGILIGGLMAAVLLISGKGRRQTFAYGPALAIGGVLSLFVGSH